MSIAVLFARDPLQHSKADIDSIIAHFREARKNFKLGGRPAAKAVTSGESEAKRLVGKIDLGDL